MLRGEDGTSWEARSQSLNQRRSPNEIARHIDLWNVAAAEDAGKLVWQFLTYDANPTIAHNVFYWESFDEAMHSKMTEAYKEFLAAKATDPNPDIYARTFKTDWRNPGRSVKVWDQHYVDFEEFFQKNVNHDSPHRAIRVVKVDHIPDPRSMIGPGKLEIDDNNQHTTFQFWDFNHGWKFFAHTTPTSSNRHF